MAAVFRITHAFNPIAAAEKRVNKGRLRDAQKSAFKMAEMAIQDSGRIEQMLTAEHRVVAFAHVSNVLGSTLDVARAVALAHGVGAKLLLDGCQAVPRLPVDVAALDCDFYVFSAHKLYGPTGIGALWARAELLDAMHKLADREIKAGRMLDDGGLMPVQMGARVSVADGKLSVTELELQEQFHEYMRQRVTPGATAYRMLTLTSEN